MGSNSRDLVTFMLPEFIHVAGIDGFLTKSRFAFARRGARGWSQVRVTIPAVDPYEGSLLASEALRRPVLKSEVAWLQARAP